MTIFVALTLYFLTMVAQKSSFLVTPFSLNDFQIWHCVYISNSEKSLLSSIKSDLSPFKHRMRHQETCIREMTVFCSYHEHDNFVNHL